MVMLGIASLTPEDYAKGTPMLFIIVMDVLTVIFARAEAASIFNTFVPWGVPHRLPLCR